MAQVTGPIVINNGAATPVAKSFFPEKVSPDGSTFTERSSAASAGYIRMNIAYSPARGGRKTNRINFDLTLPVLSTVNGVSSVAYSGLFKGYFVVPDVMTNLERADLIAFVANALDHALVRNVVKELDPMY